MKTLLILLLACFTVCTTAADRLNVLLIIADDLTTTLSCYGHPTVRSPNVDRLAVRAVRFDRAYCQYPVCSPSRVSLLSGRRPEQTRMFGNEGSSRTPSLANALFLPELFRQHGYFTARLGKVFHIGRDVSECWSVTEEGTPENRIVYQPQEVQKLGLTNEVILEGRLVGGGGEGNSWSVTRAPEERLIDFRIGTRVAELIDQNAGAGKPFFIACGFRRPHLPHLAPKTFFDDYPDHRVPLPASSPVKYPSIKVPPSEQDTLQGMRSYLACVSFMDKQLGRVLDAMDRNELWDTTVVLFLGDNGYHLGSRGGYWGKGTGYDDSCRVPLLIVTPGNRQAESSPRVVEFLDLYPTLVDLCGLPKPSGLEGRSLRPLLKSPRMPWDYPAFSIVARNGEPSKLAVTTEQYRMIENEHGKGEFELYDIHSDPREWTNLVSSAEHSHALLKLKKLAAEHRRSFWK